MHVENLLELKAWLDDGAPHVVFDMDTGVLPVKYAKRSVEQQRGVHSKGVKSIKRQMKTKGIGACGTACCIAGYAYILAVGEKKACAESEWYRISSKALEYLGLPYGCTEYGHDLFSPDLAPKGCTPAQASKAVQNVIDNPNVNPWKGV